MKKLFLSTLVLCAPLLILSTPATMAQSDEDEVTISNLKWVDEGFLSRKRAVVDELGREAFGNRVRGDKTDLRLINRIIQKELITQTQRSEQQALGVVLGDVLAKELNLKWVVFEDKYGKSRAVCIPSTEHCLFPVTMLSKRMGFGHKPDAHDMFEKAKAHLAPYFPKLPYTKKL